MDTWDPQIWMAQMRAIEAQAAIEYTREYARKTQAALTWLGQPQQQLAAAANPYLQAPSGQCIAINTILTFGRPVPEPEHCPEDKARFFNAARDIARGQ